MIAGFIMGGVGSQSVLAAEFLSPLPVQDVKVGERFQLGIRPSRAPARSRMDTKLDLFAEGLSANASFRRISDEIWELTWLPREQDKGVHLVKISVTERGSPSTVIEEEELVFIVGGVSSIKPKLNAAFTEQSTQSTPLPMASVQLTDDTILIEAASLEADTPIEPELVEPSADRAETDVINWREALADLVGKPEWHLPPLASHVVTPHQWVRFPVNVESSSESVNDYLALQVNRLPNGASFDAKPDGGRFFQWRPNTGDAGEHVFEFTALDTENAENSQTVTMRIIVQE